ncbi:MAG: tetratricopeptide repeat protein [Richelia sp. RM1_1_1]|nr:tetratricopeptide repeat protein [Richelia sp. RM1_1_1]
MSANSNSSVKSIDISFEWIFFIAALVQLIGIGLTLIILLKFYKITPKKDNNYKSKNIQNNHSLPQSINYLPIFKPVISPRNKCYNFAIKRDIKEVIADLNVAIKMNPNDAELYSKRANFRQNKLKDKKGALEDYNQAISLNPHNAYFYFWRSKIYQDLDNQRQAIEDYNTAMRLTVDENIHYEFSSSDNLTLTEINET